MRLSTRCNIGVHTSEKFAVLRQKIFAVAKDSISVWPSLFTLYHASSMPSNILLVLAITRISCDFEVSDWPTRAFVTLKSEILRLSLSKGVPSFLVMYSPRV